MTQNTQCLPLCLGVNLASMTSFVCTCHMTQRCVFTRAAHIVDCCTATLQAQFPTLECTGPGLFTRVVMDHVLNSDIARHRDTDADSTSPAPSELGPHAHRHQRQPEPPGRRLQPDYPTGSTWILPPSFFYPLPNCHRRDDDEDGDTDDDGDEWSSTPSAAPPPSPAAVTPPSSSLTHRRRSKRNTTAITTYTRPETLAVHHWAASWTKTAAAVATTANLAT